MSKSTSNKSNHAPLSSSFLLLILVANKPANPLTCVELSSVAVPQESKVFSTVPAGAPIVPVWSFGRLPILLKCIFSVFKKIYKCDVAHSHCASSSCRATSLRHLLKCLQSRTHVFEPKDWILSRWSGYIWVNKISKIECYIFIWLGLRLDFKIHPLPDCRNLFSPARIVTIDLGGWHHAFAIPGRGCISESFGRARALWQCFPAALLQLNKTIPAAFLNRRRKTCQTADVFTILTYLFVCVGIS